MSNSGKWQKYKYAVAALITVVVFYGFVSGAYFFESQHNKPSEYINFFPNQPSNTPSTSTSPTISASNPTPSPSPPTANIQPAGLAQFRQEFGNVTVSAPAQNVSPPVPMYEALTIALENGDWTATTLEGNTAYIDLRCMQIWNDSQMAVGINFSGVPQSISNYTAVTFSNATYTVTTYYVWDVTVTQTGGEPGAPVPNWWVDAATSNIVPPPADFCPG